MSTITVSLHASKGQEEPSIELIFYKLPGRSFLLVFENEGEIHTGRTSALKPNEAGSMPATLAKAAKLMRISRLLISAR